MQEGDNTKRSKFLAWTFLSIIICAFFSAIFSVTFSLNTYADTSQGDKKTAIQKMYYMAIKECIADGAFKDGLFGKKVKAKNIQNGNWFGHNVADGKKVHSAYLEAKITGKIKNDKFTCGNRGNDLLTNAMNALNLGNDYIGLACDGVNGGVFSVDEGVSCTDAIMNKGDDYNKFSPNPNGLSYLEETVKNKTFNNNVPGGSLDTFTEREKYYVYYETFANVCAGGSPVFGEAGEGLHYQISILNPSSGEFEQAGFTPRDKDKADDKISIWEGEEKSCNELEEILNDSKDELEEAIRNGESVDDVAPYSSDCNDADLNGQNWILCNTGQNLTDTAGGLFGIVENMLDVDTNLYSIGSPVYNFWEVCRNAANIIMIIILLLIIFSQLTGYGIDNYGIKKMLPKLITMAILINLSFYICQIVIDISNILGSSLDSFFGGTENRSSLGEIVIGFISGLIGVSGSVAGATVAIITITNVSGGIIGVIIGVLLVIFVIIGLLTVFVMMAIRMMIVLAVIGLAPLALACYILPNTKSIFKKWVDAFKAAILIYPIVGALHGISFIIKGIAFDAAKEQPLMFIVGCIAVILPYYIIPTLLKKAISATGMIGNAINGLGQSFKNNVQRTGNAVKNSEAFKDRMNRIGANQNQRYLNRKFDTQGRHLEGQDKRDYQALVAARNAGQDYDAARLAELEKKNLSKFSARYQRNMARANAAAEARKNKDAQTLSGASSVLSAGRTAEAETKQGLADQGAANNLRGYYRDGEGNVYSRLSSDYSWTDKDGVKHTAKAGDYIRSDSNGIHPISAADVKKGERISQGQATLAQNRINQDKQYGALGAYVTEQRVQAKNPDGTLKVDGSGNPVYERIINADAAANAANLSSLGSGVDSLTSSIQAGEGEVLQVQHVKAANEYETIKAQANAGATSISPEIAQSRAVASKIAADRKLWNDQLVRSNSEDVKNALVEGLKNNNVAQVGAAFEILQNTGNIKNIHEALSNGSIDWSTISPTMRLELDQDMIKSGDIMMSLFAKTDFGKQNGNYAEFIQGVNTTGFGTTIGEKLSGRGSHALDGQDKDIIEILAEDNNMKGILGEQNSAGEFQYASSVAKQIISGYTATQNGDEKKNFRAMIDSFANNGYSKNSDKFVETFKGAISTAALAKLDNDAIKALGGLAADGGRAEEILADAIADMKKPENAQLLATMSPTLRAKLGL